jgi:FkbM family methyltransferase
MKRPVRWIVLLLILGAVGYSYSAKFRTGFLALIGRSPDCTFSRALEAPDELARQIAIKDKLVAESKIMEKREGYNRWHTPEGDYWIPAGSDYTLHYNLAEQTRKIYGTGEQAVKEGDVVFDCGANIGLFTRVALRAGAKRIIAVEPAPENLECYRRNFSGDIESGKIILIPKGVWDKEDTLTLNVDPKNSAADSFVLKPKGSEGKIQVALTTIDNIVKEYTLDEVTFIKLDIEGAEAKALIGAAETIKRWKPRISVAAYHQPEDPKNITDAILKVRPDYKRECGPCSESNNGVRPDILWFR